MEVIDPKEIYTLRHVEMFYIRFVYLEPNV
jgi:hypothetical protein